MLERFGLRRALTREIRLGKCGLIVAICLLASTIAGMLALYGSMKSELRTRFTVGFVEAKFNSVALGDRFDAAIAKAGIPMMISIDPEVKGSEVQVVTETNISKQIDMWRVSSIAIPRRMYFIYSGPSADYGGGYEERCLYIEEGVVRKRVGRVHWD